MNRRELIPLLGGAVAAWPLVARGQQRALPVVGSLVAVTEAEWASRMAAFRRGLRKPAIWRAAMSIDYRWADGHFDRLPPLASNLVGRNVSVIFVSGSTVALRAAMSATKSIPIVFIAGDDPVEAGYVASLDRPGGDGTGFTVVNTELQPKRLELLREIIPNAAKIALLVNPNNPKIMQADIQSTTSAARRSVWRLSSSTVATKARSILRSRLPARSEPPLSWRARTDSSSIGGNRLPR